MANRSNYIAGSIERQLQMLGLPVDKIVGDDIYFQMQQAQDAIFARVGIEKEYSIMLMEGITEYPLRANISVLNNIHTQANAANPDTSLEAEATTGWSSGEGTVTATENRRTNSEGNYALKHTIVTPYGGNLLLSNLSPTPSYYQYVEFWVRANKECSMVVYLSKDAEEKCTPLILNADEDWQKVYGWMYIQGEADTLEIGPQLYTADDWLEIDDLYLLSSSPTIAAKKVVGPVIEVITPEDWDYDLDLVPHKNWNKAINTTYTTITHPVKATVFQNNLLVYPAPETSNDELKLWVYMNGSETSISMSNPPELSDSWDPAIEFFVLWKLTNKKEFYESFMGEINVHGPNEHDHGMTEERDCNW